MKKFKDMLRESQETYPADDMTIKELEIACYAAKSILDHLENGASLQRWQISAIVKASEELASVATSVGAEEYININSYNDDNYFENGY